MGCMNTIPDARELSRSGFVAMPGFRVGSAATPPSNTATPHDGSSGSSWGPRVFVCLLVKLYSITDLRKLAGVLSQHHRAHKSYDTLIERRMG